jgi:hypothetical protein
MAIFEDVGCRVVTHMLAIISHMCIRGYAGEYPKKYQTFQIT